MLLCFRRNTIRHIGCKILISTSNIICSVCTKYRNTLRALFYRQQKYQPHSPHLNMNTIVEVDEELSQDLKMIEDPSNAELVKDDFKCMF